ncbi:MAG: CFI-box-CTERM domain-containing protein [Nitrososphaerota archaeon]
MRTEFLMCFAVFVVFTMPFAFAQEQSISVNGFSIVYSSENTEISKITTDQNLVALQIDIAPQQDDTITITLPRALIDAKISDSDDDFYLLVDDIESVYEQTSTEQDRTITIPVQSHNSKITIIGTQLYESKSEQTTQEKSGCLIATATYGTELSPQVQLLREVRDNVLFTTSSGTAFMSGFNQFYYSFSPAVADLERQSPLFREAIKTIIMPMLSTLSILNYVDVDSEQKMLGYGIGIILLNIGIYFIMPALVILKIRSRFS